MSERGFNLPFSLGGVFGSQARLQVCVTGFAVACLDWVTPADINVSIFYSLAIGLCSRTRSLKWLWTSTTLFAFLSLFAYRLGTPPTTGTYALADWTNRYLTVCALFLVACFVHLQMLAEEARRKANEELEKRVKERTLELQGKNAELAQQTELVRQLSGRLLQIQDHERRRIARDLHDSVGQTLAAAGMSVSAVKSESSRLSPAVAKALSEVGTLVGEAQSEIRVMSYLLHPPLLDEVGLRSALQWYIEGFSERSKIKARLELQENFGRLPHDMELCIFRVVQECLTNIHRHSGSNVAAVRIVYDAEKVEIDIEDEGHGIPPEKQLPLASSASVGIRGMQERLRHFGGGLHVQSSPEGTAVHATIPLVNSTSKELAAKAAAG
jgi:signal transduction histidine kinase